MLNNSQKNNLRQITKKANSITRERRDRLLEESVPFIMGLITDYSPIPGTTRRWLYGWQAANIGSTGTYSFEYAAELWYKGSALNVIEGGNSASFVGPGITYSNIPSGFSVKPVEGYVLLFPGRRTNGAPIWLFSVANAVDGLCT